jgi:hypothetical protein
MYSSKTSISNQMLLSPHTTTRSTTEFEVILSNKEIDKTSDVQNTKLTNKIPSMLNRLSETKTNKEYEIIFKAFSCLLIVFLYVIIFYIVSNI